MTFYLTLVCAAVTLFWVTRGKPNTLEITYANYKNNQISNSSFFTIGDAAYFATENVTYCYVNGRRSIVSLAPWHGQESEAYIAVEKIDDEDDKNNLWIYSKETKKAILQMRVEQGDWNWRLTENTLYYLADNKTQLHRVWLDTLQDELVLESEEKIWLCDVLDSGEILYIEEVEDDLGNFQVKFFLYSPEDKSTRLLVQRWPWSVDCERDLLSSWPGYFVQDGYLWYTDYAQKKGRILRCDVKTGEVESVYDGAFSGLINLTKDALYIVREKIIENDRWEVAYYRVDMETGQESRLCGFRYFKYNPEIGLLVLNDDTYLLRSDDHVMISKNGVCERLRW
jgi:hypothetical protein